MKRRERFWILVAVLAVVGLIIALVSTGGEKTVTKTKTEPAAPPPIPSVIAVDNADKDATPDNPVTLDRPARQVAQSYVEDPKDLKGDLRGEDQGPVAKLEPPYASDSIDGCRTRFFTTNWSARGVSQSRVIVFWLHYTGGPDKPHSRADVDGLTAFGNTPSARVSWHFNMDKDGNCDYNVPLRYKAWTEANANPTGVSIEVAGVGSPPYLRKGGIKKLRSIILQVHKAYPRVKLALGGIRNCTPTKGGMLTHWMGGPCSGGHTDIKPFHITAVIKQLIAAGCDTRCKHVKAVRAHHASVHAKIKKHGCRPVHPRHEPCKTYVRINLQIHAQAKREKIKL